MISTTRLFPIVFTVALFIASLTIPFYITVWGILYGLWNPRTVIGTFSILFILECLFAVHRELFFGYTGTLLFLGVICFATFRFIRSRLAAHVLG